MRTSTKQILFRTVTTPTVVVRIIHYLLPVMVCLTLTACGDSSVPNSGAVSAPGVRLTSCKVEGGPATRAQLEQGLRTAVLGMSAAYTNLLNTTPQLKGHFRGILRVEPDGTVLNFADIHSEFSPPLAKQALINLMGASFGPGCRFPTVGNVLRLQIDCELAPGI
jgi:hypothetical protein